MKWIETHAAAHEKLTRAQILRRWPPGADEPSDVTLWRGLDWAVARQRVLREGTGEKGDPFRYWLPGQEEKLKEPPWAENIRRLNQRIRDANPDGSKDD